MSLFTSLSRLIISVVLVFSLATPLVADESKKIDTIKEYIMSHKEVRIYGDLEFGPGFYVYALAAEKILNSNWKWETHIIAVVIGPDGKLVSLKIALKKHQKFATPGRGYEHIIIVDLFADGVVDRVKRCFTMVNDDDFIISPIFPEGFVNKDWYKISKKEGQEVFNKELDYWSEMAYENRDNTN